MKSVTESDKHIKLELHDVKQAVSFPAVMDIVFYKDEKNKLYRLYHIAYAKPKKENYTQTFNRLVCLGNYAPKIIEGKIVQENKHGLIIKDKNGDIYDIHKNAEEFEFWEVDKEI
jgi:hypothetical protein